MAERYYFFFILTIEGVLCLMLVPIPTTHMVNCGSLYVLKQPFGVARPIREDINIVILYQNGNNSIKNQDDIVIVQEVVS